jgi:PPOX class probable F420-dependent enzyme
MSVLPEELRTVIEGGPLAHVTTINADGSPQVTVTWIGLDGDDIVSGHMSHKRLVQNIERDPRVVISFEAPRHFSASLPPYATIRANATVAPSDDTWDLLNRLAKVYMGPDVEFPAPRGPGYITRYKIQRIGGVGPWAAQDRVPGGKR